MHLPVLWCILNNAQFKKFFRFVADESMMKNNCRVIDMGAPVMDVVVMIDGGARLQFYVCCFGS